MKEQDILNLLNDSEVADRFFKRLKEYIMHKEDIACLNDIKKATR